MLVIFRGFSEAFENSSSQVSFEFKHDAHMEAGIGQTRIRDVTGRTARPEAESRV